MSTNFPSALDSYAELIDNSDYVLAIIPNNHADSIEAIEAKLGIDSSAVATSIDYLLKSSSSVDVGHLHSKLAVICGTGRKIYLYENAAPTGWTTVAVTDSVLAVKGGSQAYNVTGGQAAGSWSQPDHTLTTAELPSHAHSVPVGAFHTGSPNYGKAGWGNLTTPGTVDTAASGSGSAHSHGTTYRPLACVGIICAKN